MSRAFLSRSAKALTFSAPGGARRRVERCDVTVSLLATGEYRCYQCPAAAGLSSYLTRDPGDMLLHAVDHMRSGLVVPADGLKALAEEALRA